MNTLLGSLTLVEMECYSCITHFAMDRSLYDRCYQTGRSFYCPNGHSQIFTESENQRLKKQLDNANKRLVWAENRTESAKQQAEDARRSRAAIKGQLTKTRNRIANGVCPCCHRTFVNVARHMANKHSDFKEVVS